MNYFEIQRRLNQETRYLYGLFGLMLILAFVLINLIFAPLDLHIDPNSFRLRRASEFRWYTTFSLIMAFLGVFVILTNYINARMNAKRGIDIAEHLGAIEVTGRVDEPRLRILNQVVDEMALASGIPAPRVFVLGENFVINAFAAGNRLSDAVITVTEGAVRQLTRSELQALVGHEMSHIVNRDMRVNMQMFAILTGFMALTSMGASMMAALLYQSDDDTKINSLKNYLGLKRPELAIKRSSQEQKKGFTPLIFFGVFGIAFICFGYLFYLLGLFIQSRVSFRREYVADIHAITSMRAARPMRNLLYRVKRTSSRRALSVLSIVVRSEYQHFLFFPSVNHLLFKSHPPLDKRIAAVERLLSEVERMTPVKERTIDDYTREVYGQTNKPAPEPVAQIVTANLTTDTDLNQALTTTLYGLKTVKDLGVAGTMSALDYAQEILAAIPKELEPYLVNKEQIHLLYYAFFMSPVTALRNQQATLFSGSVMTEILAIERLIHEADIDYTYIFAELTFPLVQQLTYGEREAMISKIEVLMTYLTVGLTHYCLYFSLQKLIRRKDTDRPLASLLSSNKKQSISEQINAEHIFNLFSIVTHVGDETKDPKVHEYAQSVIKRFYPQAKRRLVAVDKDNWLELIQTALVHIDLLHIETKKEVIEGLIDIVNFDNKITDKEYNVLRFVSLCIGYPLPLNLRLID